VSALISILVVLAFTDWGVLAYVLTGRAGPQLHPHPAYYGYVYHAALQDAARWGHIAGNVAASADLPKGMAPEMRVVDLARQDRLYAAWLLSATTGMRRGEVAGLRWSDVDLDAGLRWSDVDLDAGRVSPRRPRVVRIRLHDVRHSYASAALAAGIPA
jgi:integrase